MSFWQTPLGDLILIVGETLALLVPLLIMVAYLTYAERKVLAAVSEAPRETPFAPAANDAPPPAPAAAPAGNLAQLARAFSRRV